MAENIPFIHNYCDRWCERCEFTSRCAVYEMEQDTTDEERDIHNAAFWNRLTAIFKDAQSMLREKAAEFGIDVDAIDYEEIEAKQKIADAKIHSQKLTKLAQKYSEDSEKILDSKDEWLKFSPGDENAQNELLSILYWYQYFIFAKVSRGFHGITDLDGEEETEELTDTQSDANGSIKIALIAIDRSIMGWTLLLSEENDATLRPLINLLEKIRRKCFDKFPHAKDFIRPGFDEMEAVM